MCHFSGDTFSRARNYTIRFSSWLVQHLAWDVKFHPVFNYVDLMRYRGTQGVIQREFPHEERENAYLSIVQHCCHSCRSLPHRVTRSTLRPCEGKDSWIKTLMKTFSRDITNTKNEENVVLIVNATKSLHRISQ